MAIRRRGTWSAFSASSVSATTRANPFRRHTFRHVFERGVGGDVADPHIAVNQQHHAVARMGEIGEQFRVAAIVVAREVERFLADRPCADGVSYAVERKRTAVAIAS